MQISSISKILLSHTEVQKACAEYIKKNGVMGADTQYENVMIQHHNGTVQATLEVHNQVPSKKECTEISKNTVSEHSQKVETKSQLQLPLETLPLTESKESEVSTLTQEQLLEESEDTLQATTIESEGTQQTTSSEMKSKPVESKTSKETSNSSKKLEEESTEQVNSDKTSTLTQEVSEKTNNSFNESEMKTSPLFRT